MQSWIGRCVASALLEDDFRQRGMSPGEARFAARRTYGNVEPAKQMHREERSLLWLEQLRQDVRYTMRQFRRSPGFAVTVILTIALGIGANTAIFTLIHSILLKSLPVADPKSLYRIGDVYTECCLTSGLDNENGDFSIFSWENYRHLRATTPEFEQLAAVQAGQGLLSVRRGQSMAQSRPAEYFRETTSALSACRHLQVGSSRILTTRRVLRRLRS